MSFSSGTFSINTAGQPVVTGTTISSTAFNTLTADLATGLTTCVLKDGTQTTTAAVPFAAGITLSGSASNIATGSNYISYGGTDAGLSFDASNIATFSAAVNGTTATFSGTGSSVFRINGNLNINNSGAVRGTQDSTNAINLLNGTAPIGAAANIATLYAQSGEMWVMDAGGTATQISPHDPDTNEWIFNSKNPETGAHLRIDVEAILRKLNEHFGWDHVHEAKPK